MKIINNKYVFDRLTPEELQNVEGYLLGKKYEYRINKGKIKRKTGAKSGKTKYSVDDHILEAIENKKYLTLKDFCILYNKEIRYLGYDTMRKRLFDDELVLKYLLTKNLIKVDIRQRTLKRKKDKQKTIRKENYIYRLIPNNKKEKLLDFVINFVSSETIDNSEQMKQSFRKNQERKDKIDKLVEDFDKTFEKRNKSKKRKKVKRTINIK